MTYLSTLKNILDDLRHRSKAFLLEMNDIFSCKMNDVGKQSTENFSMIENKKKIKEQTRKDH